MIQTASGSKSVSQSRCTFLQMFHFSASWNTPSCILHTDMKVLKVKESICMVHTIPKGPKLNKQKCMSQKGNPSELARISNVLDLVA
jgi:hypothetical protein